jgi:SAM-dependent methyltransferase
VNINDFAQLWQNEKKLSNIVHSQELWDSRADEVNRRIGGDFDARKDKLLKFFEERGIFNDENKILDIGCGPGRYSSEFAKRAKKVTGIDISAKMIQYAKQNTAGEDLNRACYETVAWEDVDLDARGWRKEYDLVFASMCPGISGGDALLKMCEASRGYCFTSGFVEKKDEIGDRLYRAVHGEEPRGLGKHLFYTLNILFLSGYYPEIRYHDNEWEQVLTVEQALETYCTRLRWGKEESADLPEWIVDYLGSIANNGLIREKSRGKIAWVFWKV